MTPWLKTLLLCLPLASCTLPCFTDNSSEQFDVSMGLHDPLRLELQTDEESNYGVCRYSDDMYMEPAHFAVATCSLCYWFMGNESFVKGKKLELRWGFLWDPSTKKTLVPNITDPSSPVWDTFSSKKATEQWVECCQASVKCCETMRNTPQMLSGSFCPRTWDGWGCWPDTPAGTTAKLRCPHYIYHHSEKPVCSYYALKECTVNGTWYKNSWDHEWSNYTVCSQREDISAMQWTHVTAFSVSIVLLLPAIFIFLCYKQLHVFRVAMHRNLFISLALNAIFVIAFETYFMSNHRTSKGSEQSRLEENSVGCKLFYAITKYLRLSNYVWMFCEGLYLHKLITAAFSEQKSILKFYIIGWGMPMVPVCIWAALRQIRKEADTKCWTLPYRHYEWIIYVPMLLSLVINIGFLANILRVIISKLRATRTTESSQLRRAVRATVALIPLFGVHFFFILYHPRINNCILARLYVFVTYAIDGLQGAIVAVLFCYMNNEVINLLKRSYKRRKLVRSVGSHTSHRRMLSRDSRLSLSTNMFTLGDSTINKRNSK